MKQISWPSGFWRDPVRNLRVPWRENLTLAQAILATEYTSKLDPARIFIFRQGQTYRVDPRRLLRGLEDPFWILIGAAARANPNGIPSLSPGLARHRRAYPG